MLVNKHYLILWLESLGACKDATQDIDSMEGNSLELGFVYRYFGSYSISWLLCFTHEYEYALSPRAGKDFVYRVLTLDKFLSDITLAVDKYSQELEKGV